MKCFADTRQARAVIEQDPLDHSGTQQGQIETLPREHPMTNGAAGDSIDFCSNVQMQLRSSLSKSGENNFSSKFSLLLYSHKGIAEFFVQKQTVERASNI